LATLTVEGAKLGTPLYMSPEQIRGEPLDGRADQFAWGVVAFELITGKLPWRVKNDALALAASILTEEPDEGALRAAGAPDPLVRVVLRALSKKVSDRFESIDALLAALGPPDSATIPDARGPDRARAMPNEPAAR